MNEFSRRLLTSALLALVLLAIGCGGDDKENPLDSRLPATPGDNWRLTLSGSNMSLLAVAWSGTRFVAVGGGGKIQSSDDGSNWTDQVSGVQYTLFDVAWCDSMFIAVGFYGTILQSSDGLTWTKNDFHTDKTLTAVATDGERIVILGGGGYYMSKDGGESWAIQDPYTTEYLISIVFNQGRWLAGTNEGSCFSSTDGYNWVEIQIDLPANATLRHLVGSDHGFFLTAVIEDTAASAYSTVILGSIDGLHWEQRITIDHRIGTKLVWSGSEILALGIDIPSHGSYAGSIYSSSDGLNWVEQESDSPVELHDAAASNGRLVVVGTLGYVLTGSNASNLTVQTSGVPLMGVVWNGYQFVAASRWGSVVTSTNGTNWSERVADGIQTVCKMAFSGDRYVAIDDTQPRRIYYSDDATNWTQATTPSNFRFMRAICWGNDRFVITGMDGNVAVSTDGVSWTVYNVGANMLLISVFYDGDRFIAAGGHKVLSSPDGTNWVSTDLDLGRACDITNLSSSDYLYVALAWLTDDAGSMPAIIVSDDAITWEAIDSPVDYLLPNEVKWTGSKFLICGDGGMLLSSTNGRDWTIIETGTDNNLNDIAIGPDRWVVVGNQRTVLVSP